MNFEYSDEQKMLKDAVERMVADRYGLEGRKAAAASSTGFPAENWALFAELGLLGLPFAEDHGGFGGGAVETAIVMEALGRGPSTEPYLGAVVLAGAVLRHAGGPERLAELVPGIADGSRILAFAHEEDSARHVASHVTTSASRSGSGWVLNGTKTGVLAGVAADLFLVSARTAGASGDASGLTLFAVPANHPGVTRTPYLQYDGQMVAALAFTDVHLDPKALVGTEGEAFPVIEQALDEAIAAICAEAVGTVESMLWITVEYLKTRQQFGGPLARFQALQHRCAEMFVMVEQARSMALYAAFSLGNPDRDERRRAISAAKVQICESARFVGYNSVQLHGGIGVTEECLVGHHFRRTSMIERQFGDIGHHLAALDRLGGLDNQLEE